MVMVDRIEWYGQDKRVVLQTYEDRTTWESFLDIATQSATMLNSVDYPVQVIVNRTNAFYPKFQPTKMRIIGDMVPINQDLVVVVGAEYSVETLSKVIGSRVASRAFDGTFYVGTIEHAHDILKRERNIEL